MMNMENKPSIRVIECEVGQDTSQLVVVLTLKTSQRLKRWKNRRRFINILGRDSKPTFDVLIDPDTATLVDVEVAEV